MTNDNSLLFYHCLINLFRFRGLSVSFFIENYFKNSAVKREVVSILVEMKSRTVISEIILFFPLQFNFLKKISSIASFFLKVELFRAELFWRELFFFLMLMRVNGFKFILQMEIFSSEYYLVSRWKIFQEQSFY